MLNIIWYDNHRLKATQCCKDEYRFVFNWHFVFFVTFLHTFSLCVFSNTAKISIIILKSYKIVYDDKNKNISTNNIYDAQFIIYY